MDFFKELSQDCIIREYLKDFPELDWKEVVKKTLLYGIHSLKALENFGLLSPKPEKIPSLHSELTQMKKNTPAVNPNLSCDLYDIQERKTYKKKLENSKDQSKLLRKTRGLSQKSLKEKSKTCQSAAIRGNSKDTIKQPPFRLTGKERPETKRKLPRYLQNINSKIKDDVKKTKKSIIQAQSRTEKRYKDEEIVWDELKSTELNNGKIPLLEKNEDSSRSGSSFSEYMVPEVVKDFYQKEFSKLLPFAMDEGRKNSHEDRKKVIVFASSPSDSDT
ncbi:hypothetical protein SteCoe_7726 [Stentor coeruleus]|uniref:Uncharacterized protein n=1 Tax=Stentor coeruleus TaxID=5963 RepID=A0A1R2CM03_9CILI|nr:hypothetical protein SteCoe_7726 [Stentor coeruleus]